MMKTMFWGVVTLTILGLAGCKTKQSQSALYDMVQDSVAAEPGDLTHARALEILDSLGQIPLPAVLKESQKPYMDNLHAVRHLSRTFDPKELQEMMDGETGALISKEQAKRLFVEKSAWIDSLEDDEVPLTMMTMGQPGQEDAPTLYCLGAGMEWECDCYVAQKNRLIALTNVYYRYGFDFNHFVDADGLPVFWFQENFASGTGIWEWYYVFYKVKDGRLIPGLTFPSVINLAMMGQEISLQTKVKSTNPLRMQTTYETNLISLRYDVIPLAKGKINHDYTWQDDAYHLVKPVDLSPAWALNLYDGWRSYLNVFYPKLRGMLVGDDPMKAEAVRQKIQWCWENLSSGGGE